MCVQLGHHTVLKVLTLVTVQSDGLSVHKGVMLFCVADIVCCVIMYHSSTDTPEKTYESIVATQLHFSVCVSVLRHV